MSYQSAITNKQKALVHLLIYCTYHDDKFSGEEYSQLKRVSGLIRSFKEINVDAEVDVFKSYKNDIGDLSEFLLFLVKTMSSKYPLAIFSYATQMLVADINLTDHDKEVLKILAAHLKVSEGDHNAIVKTMIARQLLTINFM